MYIVYTFFVNHKTKTKIRLREENSVSFLFITT